MQKNEIIIKKEGKKMKNIEHLLRDEMEKLDQIITAANQRLIGAPPGKMRLSTKPYGVQCYLKDCQKESDAKEFFSYEQDEMGQAPSASLKGTNFKGTNLKGTNLKGTNFKGTNHQEITLRRTNDKETNIQKIAPKGADIKGEKSKCKNGQYIRKKENDLVRRLAQKEYDEVLLKNALKRKKVMERFLKGYEETGIEKIYEKLHPYRRELLQDVIVSDEKYVEEWEQHQYCGKMFDENAPEIYTEKGERVRSKSEKIIADKLFLMGIPYRYECPLRLTERLVVHPDFTILKVAERKELYWEHFGMMDDADYVENVMMKLSSYEKNGIFLGINLFVTFETAQNPLNARALDAILKKLFF